MSGRDGRAIRPDGTVDWKEAAFGWRRRALSADARVAALEAALRVYADPRNWGISRDDLNFRVVSWIGPGAERRGLPDAPGTARAALEEKP